VSEYKLKIVYRVWAPKEGGVDYAMQEKEGIFTCTVEDGRLLIPPEAQRIIHKRAKGVLGVNSMKWIGERPDVFKSGVLTEEQAAMLSDQYNTEGDLAMKLLDETEPEEAMSIMGLLGPSEGEIKVIGEADYETDVPLLHPNFGGDDGGRAST